MNRLHAAGDHLKIPGEIIRDLANENSKDDAINERKPYNPNQSLQEPSRDVRVQRRIARKIGDQLTNMSETLLNFMEGYAKKSPDHKFQVDPNVINYIADAPTKKDYLKYKHTGKKDASDKEYEKIINSAIASYGRANLNSLIKIMIYCADAIYQEHTPNIPTATAQDWLDNGLIVFTNFKIPSATFTKLCSMLLKIGPNKAIPDSQWKKISEQGEAVRDLLYHKDNRIITKIFSDPSSNKEMKALLVNLMTFYRSNSDSSYNSIAQKLHVLGDPVLTKALKPAAKIDNAEKAVEDFERICQQISGNKKAQYLTKSQVEKLKPAQKQQYDKLRLAATAAYKETLQSIVRSSGAATMLVEQVKKALIAAGMPLWRIPTGFKGLLDEQGRQYTTTGKMFKASQLGGTMTMNDSYNPKTDNGHISIGKGLNVENPVHHYTLEWAQGKRQDKKHEAVDALRENFDDIKKEWRKDIVGRDANNKVLGYMAECLYRTQARVGSPYAKSNGKTTYGLSTWKLSHLHPNQDSVRISYSGKKGVVIGHTVKDHDNYATMLINYLKQLKTKGSPNDPVWKLSNGKSVTNAMLNTYLKSIGSPATAHKFRHARATEIVEEFMEAHPLKKKANQKEAEAYIKKVAEMAGKQLGHSKTTKDGKQEPTGTTALVNYIDPQMLLDFFRERHLELPGWLEKVVKEPTGD